MRIVRAAAPRKHTRIRREVYFWRLMILGLFLASFLFMFMNNSWSNTIEVLAVKKKHLRHVNYNHPVATQSKSTHPLQGEWDVFIPNDQSYSLFLQFENLLESNLYDRSHAVKLKNGRHRIRFYREQLTESQLLHVWVDDDEVFNVSMNPDWQRSTTRLPIHSRNYYYLEKWTPQNHLVLEGYRFREIHRERRINGESSQRCAPIREHLSMTQQVSSQFGKGFAIGDATDERLGS